MFQVVCSCAATQLVQRMLGLSLLVGLLALTSSCNGQSWRRIDGALTHVSVGESGVWRVNGGGQIFYLEDTLKVPDNAPSCATWHMIAGSLKQLDVGNKFVIGVNSGEEIYFRTGISSSQPSGKDWSRLDGLLKHVTVSSLGAIWGVNSADETWFRGGTNNQHPEGSDWQKVDGALAQVSVGPSGVWGVNASDAIWYRDGTFGGDNAVGTGWTQVPGKLIYVTSGSKGVFGVNRQNQIWRRTGVTPQKPTGSVKQKVPTRSPYNKKKAQQAAECF